MERGPSESLKTFNARFSAQAQATKFNALADTATKLHEFIASILLLAKYGVFNTERVAVLAATASNDANLYNISSKDRF